jgi:hypothetical protein
MTEQWHRVGDPQPKGGGFLRWAECEVGFEITGTWLGTLAGEFGDYGVLELADGRKQKFGLPAGLERRLACVAEGRKVKIVFLGKKDLREGRSFYLFDVYSDAPPGVPPADDDTPF